MQGMGGGGGVTLNGFTYVTTQTHLEIIKGLRDYNLFTSRLHNQENEDGHALNLAADCLGLFKQAQNYQSNEIRSVSSNSSRALKYFSILPLPTEIQILTVLFLQKITPVVYRLPDFWLVWLQLVEVKLILATLLTLQ